MAYVVTEESSQDLWIYDFARGMKTRLTNGQNTSYPVWSAEGRFVVYQAFGGMFWTRADGGGGPQPLTRSKAIQLPGSFSPDGKWLAYSEQMPGAEGEMRIVPVESASGGLRAREPQVFLKTATVPRLPLSRPTDDGWRMRMPKAGAIRSTCGLFRIMARRCRSPIPAASNRRGRGMDMSCSIGPTTSASWWRTTL